MMIGRTLSRNPYTWAAAAVAAGAVLLTLPGDRAGSLQDAYPAPRSPVPNLAAHAEAGTAAPARSEPATARDDDDPRGRQSLFYRRRAYPFDTIPHGARLAALETARRIRRETEQHRRAEGLWTNIGPFGADLVAGAWSPPAWGRTAGRIRALAAHPTNPSVLYVGAADGGLWKTSDGGQTFLPMTDQEVSLATGAIAIDPSNPETVYVGTGEMALSADSYYGAGVLKSTDSGSSWQRLGATEFSQVAVASIVVHPSASGTLLVGTGSSCCTTGSTMPPEGKGVYRSTDAGATWTQTLKGEMWSVVGDPTNGAFVYASMRADATNAGFWKSTDGGQTWDHPRLNGLPVFTSFDYIRLAIDQRNPATLFLSYGGSVNQKDSYRSTDSGASWAKLSTADICGGQCWYDQYIAVHPLDSNQVFIGGIGWARSTNGGDDWETVFATTNSPSWIDAPVHVDHHAIAFHPTDPSTFYLGNDGGLWRTTDNGQSWLSLNDRGLSITQFYHVALHPTSSDYMLAGAQDNSPHKYSGNAVWQAIATGDGAFSAINPANPSIQYISTQYLSLQRSTDHGGTWTSIGPDPADAGFIAPFVLDPADPSLVIGATTRFLLGSNNGSDWTYLGDPWPVQEYDTASALAVAGSTPRTLYGGTDYGAVVVSTDGGQTMVASSGLPDRSVTDLAVDTADANHAFVTFSGFGTGHVYRTTNAGQDWFNASGNLPNGPVNSIVLVPATTTAEAEARAGMRLFVGTDVGVFVSEDLGATWADYSPGLPNVVVMELAYSGSSGKLVAATHGRGVWVFDADATPPVPVGNGTAMLILAATCAVLWLAGRRWRSPEPGAAA
ncbi:MAG: hypothetical protein HYV63_09935 [Candidatus Schekmanbacteria bacterium]|nr:hypothetical protein [Candidatus Schekmanbacteria bacterium]